MKVIVSANDEILYYARLERSEWICGRCSRGTVKPVAGAQCTHCPGRVSLIVVDEVVA